MSYATLKMLGYSHSGIGRSEDWADERQVGIRIARSRRPNSEFFHDGRLAVIYDSARKTVPIYGEFRSDPYELDEPEYGCHLAVRFQAAGVARDFSQAPRLHDVLPGFDVKQKSYRRLQRHEYQALVAAIQKAPGFFSLEV
jgi:hypothetical protein